jgi:AraC-like DNA-binding protein
MAAVMNCDDLDAKRVESAGNARLGGPPFVSRRDSRRLVRSRGLTLNADGKDRSEANHSDSPTLTHQILNRSREELARLVEILRDSRCIAVVRGIDGSASSVTAAELTDGVKLDEKVSASIRDPQGTPLASVDLLPKEGIDSHQTRALLLAIAASTANAITERFFRIHYRQQWIMAAQCTGQPGERMLLAVDRDYRVLGADYQAQHILRSRGMRFEPGLSLAAFFRMTLADLRGGRHFETIRKLTSYDDDRSWFVLTTSPDLEASYFDYSDRAQLHSRPRMVTVAPLGEVATQRRDAHGLPPRMLGRIRTSIEEGLESGVDIEGLAGTLGYSLSHFFRLFRRSFGMPPHRYVMHRRISLAQELLTQTNLDLACIALKCGFADQSHLCRNFHRIIGLPPGAFRMRQRRWYGLSPDSTSSRAQGRS